jgi:hypothetical protein
VESLDGDAVRRFELRREAVEDHIPAGAPSPAIVTNTNGWPTSATWPGMNQPLFSAGLGDLVSVQVKAFAPRWALQDIWGTSDPARRREAQASKLEFVTARSKGMTAREDGAHTIVFSQSLDHPRVRWATRRLEVWKREPRARPDLPHEPNLIL